MTDFRDVKKRLGDIISLAARVPPHPLMYGHAIAIPRVIVKPEECLHDGEKETYRWHHGYGDYCTGEICKKCRSRRSFEGMGLWMTDEEYRNMGRSESWEG